MTEDVDKLSSPPCAAAEPKSDQETFDLIARLLEGRTKDMHWRWTVTEIHGEAAQHIAAQAAEIARLKADRPLPDGSAEE